MKSILWTVSPHAKDRAWERYEVFFSPRKWESFCQTMQKGKNAIRLAGDGFSSYRFACYFQCRWFIIACSINGSSGSVLTFLPISSLTDADKTILQSDERYRRINDDSLNALSQTISASFPVRNKQRIQKISLSPDELPPDFDQALQLLESNLKPF